MKKGGPFPFNNYQIGTGLTCLIQLHQHQWNPPLFSSFGNPRPIPWRTPFDAIGPPRPFSLHAGKFTSGKGRSGPIRLEELAAIIYWKIYNEFHRILLIIKSRFIFNLCWLLICDSLLFIMKAKKRRGSSEMYMKRHWFCKCWIYIIVEYIFMTRKVWDFHSEVYVNPFKKNPKRTSIVLRLE